MALEPGIVFAVTSSAYRNGVLDSGMAILGDAIDGAMTQTGCGMGDLVNRMDDASERAVMRIDSMLERSGLLLRLASSDRLMGLLGRLLDLAAVRRAGVFVLTRMLVRIVSAP